MSDSAPDQDPKAQPEFSDGPPRWLRLMAIGVDDESSRSSDPTVNLVKATMQASYLMSLVQSIRGSQDYAINTLQADLDACVVWISKLIERLGPEDRESALWRLNSIRDFRFRHPRLLAGPQEIREQAQKILDELKKFEP